LTYYFTLHPFVFFFSRVFEGFIMGFYWSSLQSSISDSGLEKIDTLISRYNFSWNFGILSGFLIGFILLFSLNELLFIFYISPLFLLLMILISTCFFKEPPKFNSVNSLSLASHSPAIPSSFQTLNSKNEENHLSLNTEQFHIPIAIPIYFIVFFALSATGINFLYPLKSEILGFPAYTTYLLAFLALIMQTTVAFLSTKVSLSILMKWSLPSILIMLIVEILFGITSSFLIFIFLFLFIGSLNGFFYSIALKIFIFLNILKNTSKYSGIAESANGISFFFSTNFLSLIAAISLNYSFFFLSMILGIFLIIHLILMKKIIIPKTF